MKYVIYSLIIIAVCIFLSILTVIIINKISKKKRKGIYNFLIGIGVFVLGLGSVFLFFVYDYYHADEKAYDYLRSTNTVDVSKKEFGYFFDGKGRDNCIIFYPGAKVEIEAYAPLMYNLAESGIDTFLIHMPLNMASLGKNKAEEILNNYNYKNYYMAGHSLGGVIASKFSLENDKIDGIIFLASYSTVKLDESIKALSIYGSEDKVLNQKEYNKNISNFPSNYKEVIIEGANHAQFGMYNSQKGDGIAKIDNLYQIELTKEEIIKFILN